MPRAFQELVLTDEQRECFLARVQAVLSPSDFQLVADMCLALPEILALVKQDPMSIRKLRHLLFGPRTEKTDKICPPLQQPESPPPQSVKPRPKSHGRRPASHYTGARWIAVPHPTLHEGNLCESCRAGHLRRQRRDGVAMRLVGSPPVSATIWTLEKLRCDCCGKLFTAPAPPEAGPSKYDESVGATVALLRYGCGMPHYRLAGLQKSLGVPLPESTQWELMVPLADQAEPILDELAFQAAQGPLVYNDDTKMRVSDLRRESTDLIPPKRKGTFTTCIIGTADDHPVALFLTGWQHGGENLAEFLRERSTHLEPPIQMCDGLSRNTCGEFETILAHCMAHGRRGFVEVATAFPEECRHVLQELKRIYQADEEAKKQTLTPEQRLLYHQNHSKPVMDRLQLWLQAQLDQKRVEPNSGLGQAMEYFLGHWEPLTLFLRRAGAPLDNNVTERALKMAILHRKNSLHYKTSNGARVGDLFMSLIQTCRLNEVNPFEYLLAIARNPESVRLRPAAWLPWNFPRSTSGTDTS